MSGDSQASFSRTIKRAIRRQCRNRCATCLGLYPEVSIQSAHMLDSESSDSAGARLQQTAVGLGILSADYKRSSLINGMVQCCGCHGGFFTPNLIALSPSLPVLDYVFKYIWEAPDDHRKPLHEVFNLLRLAMKGNSVDLPNPTSILPYLGLFTIVVLKPSELVGCVINTSYLPTLSIIRNNRFEPAPIGTSPADPKAARIFDSLALAGTTPPKSLGEIPLSPEHPEFSEWRYWRLPLQIEAVMSGLMDRVGNQAYECKEINLVQNITGVLSLRRRGVRIARDIIFEPSHDVGPGGSGNTGGGPSSGSRNDSGSGGGPSDSGGGNLKRSRDDSPTASAAKKTKQAASSTDEPQDKDSEDVCPLEMCERSVSPEGAHQGVHPDEWEVDSSFSTRSGEGSFQTRSPYEGSTLKSNSSDSDDVVDDPKKWKFGPQFRSDLIIVNARGKSLV